MGESVGDEVVVSVMLGDVGGGDAEGVGVGNGVGEGEEGCK